MRYIIGSTATVAILALGSMAGAQTMQGGSEPTEVTAEVVMKDKAFHITHGNNPNGILLRAGTHADIRLRNEDNVAHEIVSTMFYNLRFQISGEGTRVGAPKAAGVRVGPGETVVLSFEVPYDYYFRYGSAYEYFWCNVHAKVPRDEWQMPEEIMIVNVR